MEMQGSRRIRVALVGAGYVAQHHLGALKTLDFVDIVGIADLDIDAAEALGRRFRVARAVRKLEELRDLHPDAVYVLTPPASHASVALEALDMGCHVLVEKPLAESVEECERMIARAKQVGRVLGVNHSDRLDPAVLEALELVRSGACGEVVAVDFLRSSEYPPYAGGPLPAVVRQGSYPFRDLGVHGLYLLEAFLGPVRQIEVSFHGTGRNPNLRYDEWFATAECERGVGRMQISWNVRPMQSRLIVQGTRAVVEVDRFLQIVRVNRSLPGPKFIGMVLTAFVTALKDAIRVPGTVLRFATGRLQASPGIRRGAVEFAVALRDGTPPPVSAEEGLHVVAALSTAFERADASRTEELHARLAPLPQADALVTGASGFLGRALVQRLHSGGGSLRVLVRRVPLWLEQLPGVQVVLGDLGDPEIVEHAVKGVSTVFHVGAAMKGSPRDFEAGTVWGTRNVVNSCLRNGTKKVIYVSSLSVMDHAGRDAGVALTEHSPLEPHPERRGSYTQTKLQAEHIVREAIRDSSLPAVVLRPGQIFGPGAERVTPNGVVALLGRWIAVGPSSQRMPLVYVDDVVDAMLLAAERTDGMGRVINIVDPTEPTQAEYLAACKRQFGPQLKLTRTPTALFLLLAMGVELLGKLLRRSVPLTRYRVRSLRPLANFDLTTASSVLGWRPRIGVREGLKRTFGSAAN